MPGLLSRMAYGLSRAAVDIGKSGLEEAREKRLMEIRRGYQKEDKAEQRQYEKEKTAEERKYLEGKTAEERKYLEGKTAEERKYQEGREKTAFERQQQITAQRGGLELAKQRERQAFEKEIGKGKPGSGKVTYRKMGPTDEDGNPIGEQKEVAIRDGQVIGVWDIESEKYIKPKGDIALPQRPAITGNMDEDMTAWRQFAEDMGLEFDEAKMRRTLQAEYDKGEGKAIDDTGLPKVEDEVEPKEETFEEMLSAAKWRTDPVGTFWESLKASVGEGIKRHEQGLREQRERREISTEKMREYIRAKNELRKLTKVKQPTEDQQLRIKELLEYMRSV